MKVWQLVLLIISFFIFTAPVLKEKVVYKSIINTVYVPEYRSVYDLQPNYRYKVPSKEVIQNMDDLANAILLPLEKHFGYTITDKLTSFCRDWPRGSEHVSGRAVDIDMGDDTLCVTNNDIYNYIRDNRPFNQLIVYNSVDKPGHVHVSFYKYHNKCDVRLAKWRYRRGWKYDKI